jgi:YD repeat-containing protein
MPIKIRYAILISFFTMALLGGCKKDPASTATTTSRVKTESTSSQTGIAYAVSYVYDSSGRQVQSTNDTIVTTYVYAMDTITKTIALAGHHFITGYSADASGRIVSDSKFFKYGYDADGYLTSLSYTGNGRFDSTVYTISGGNISSVVLHQVDSATDNRVITSYTYLSNRDTRDYGMSAYGKANANLIGTQSITQVNNGSTTTANYTYTYSYDAQGRVTQQVRSSGSVSYTTTYTYY